MSPSVRTRAVPVTDPLRAVANAAGDGASCGTYKITRVYHDRKVAAGKTNMEALRCLKRRLSDIIYARMRADATRPATSPGGHSGGDTSIQRGRLTPRHRHFGPVTARTRRQPP